MVVGENMDIMSIRGAEHVPVVREDTEEVVRPTVWKEVLCGSGELVESGWYKVAVRVDRCVEYNGCMNCGSKTMEDPLSGKRHCGKCKSALWSSVKKYKVAARLTAWNEFRRPRGTREVACGSTRRKVLDIAR